MSADELVGKYVRLANLQGDCNPAPIRVTEALPDGRIRLEGWSGKFQPQMFVVVEEAERV
jgi:hypothetical protein